MGRRLQPIPLPTNPSLALFFLVAWVLAATAVVLSLCATCNRKSSRKPSSSPRSHSSDESVSKPAAAEPAPAAQPPPEDQEEARPPQEAAAAAKEGNTTVTVIDDVATHGPIPPAMLPMSASKRRMSLSFSKGLPDKLRMSRRERKGEGGEDSLWKKTIILGEKCKVGSDDEEEEVVVVDEKGNKQRYYHPRTPRSRQASRNSSFAYHDEASTTTGAADRGTGDRREVEN